jgi:hypothetical protein
MADLTRIFSQGGAPFTVSSQYAPKFQALLDDLERSGYAINAQQSGGYNPRNIAGTRTPSQHAFGRAIDVNWTDNARGTKGNIDPKLAQDLAAKHGFTWGGLWKNPDPMHFEIANAAAPAVAQRSLTSYAGLGGPKEQTPAPSGGQPMAQRPMMQASGGGQPGLIDALMNPMTLAGLSILGSPTRDVGQGMQIGMQAQNQAAKMDELRRQRALEDQQREAYMGLLSDPEVLKSLGAGNAKVAQAVGPQLGIDFLTKSMDPNREIERRLKEAQIAKIERDNSLASQEAERKKALQEAFLGGGAPPAAAPPQVQPNAKPMPEGVGRFSPAMGGEPPKQPQTPREIFEALPPNKRAAAQVALARGDMEGFQKIIAEGAPNLADNLSPGEKRVDQTFAKTYEDFILSGGAADFDKNLAQLQKVEKNLSAGRKVGDTQNTGKQQNLTGPLLGMTPDWIGAYVNPEAVDARQKVEEIVQRNLRIILGAQFTQKEGENLIARAYNPSLSEEKNAVRLRALISSMEKMKQAKMRATDYFEQNGTMKGFKGSTQFSVDVDTATGGGTTDGFKVEWQ